jgi:hypothetical protein
MSVQSGSVRLSPSASLSFFHKRTSGLPSLIPAAAWSVTLPLPASNRSSPFRCSRRTTSFGHRSSGRSMVAWLTPNGSAGQHCDPLPLRVIAGRPSLHVSAPRSVRLAILPGGG